MSHTNTHTHLTRAKYWSDANNQSCTQMHSHAQIEYIFQNIPKKSVEFKFDFISLNTIPHTHLHAHIYSDIEIVLHVETGTRQISQS